MTKINIDELTEAELIDLNHRIVERLKLLNQMRAHAHMLEFKIGDRVTFHSQEGSPLVGILTRYNKKTVTVITEDGHRWNVSPGLLDKADAPRKTSTSSKKVIPLKKK